MATYKRAALDDSRCGMVLNVDNSSSGQFHSIPRTIIN